VIEQAKGMLMLVYGLDAAAAFDLLRWRSQESNIKLRRLAQQLVEDFRAIPTNVWGRGQPSIMCC
jgi:AmiR/NasT family two-component response regulator